MNLPGTAASYVTIPAMQIASGSLILGALLVVIAFVVFCQILYPRKLEVAFHVPEGIGGITATELILFRIFVVASFLLVLRDILTAKLL